MASSYYISIDPGKTGAMAIFECTNKNAKYYLLKILDFTPPDILDILYKIHTDIRGAFIERVHSAPGQGVSSTFNFGANFGWWIGVLEAFEIPYEMISPNVWSPTVVGRCRDKKKAAILKAVEVLNRPYDNLFDENGKSWFRLAKHHGRADAVLIGYFGMVYKGKLEW